MQTLPSRARDSDWVGVTLSPRLAREVARALQIQLACEFERPFDASLPGREDAGRLRTLLDLCVDQLETLDWGEPPGDVQMMAPRVFLESIGQDLRDGGNERLANPLGWDRPELQRVRRQGRQMIRAADAINVALASDVDYEIAS